MSYTSDAENRLRAVTPVSPAVGDLRAEFAYDYLGRRTVQTVSSWTGSAWTVVSETKYVWAGWLMLMELDGLSSDAVLRRNTWGLDLAGQMGSVGVPPASLQSAGGIGGLLAVSDANGTPANPNDDLAYVYFYDANGNVGQVFDPATQTVVAHYEYDPYGNVTNDLSGYSYAETNRWRFSTKQFDAATGLGYWGRRYYEPVLGRWMNHDPIEEAGGANLYGYVRNAPVGAVDLLGLQEASDTGCGGRVSGRHSSALDRGDSFVTYDWWFDWECIDSCQMKLGPLEQDNDYSWLHERVDEFSVIVVGMEAEHDMEVKRSSETIEPSCPGGTAQRVTIVMMYWQWVDFSISVGIGPFNLPDVPVVRGYTDIVRKVTECTLECCCNGSCTSECAITEQKYILRGASASGLQWAWEEHRRE